MLKSRTSFDISCNSNLFFRKVQPFETKIFTTPRLCRVPGHFKINTIDTAALFLRRGPFLPGRQGIILIKLRVEFSHLNRLKKQLSFYFINDHIVAMNNDIIRAAVQNTGQLITLMPGNL